ncbi:unnamed protein product [Arabidopsis lyrata]|nr:unnamed protein product [Arabidopsis lyrata]
MVIMLSGNFYPFAEESLFEDGYREIYGDPIYDIYEDDDVLVIDHVDFVFSDGAFEKICAEFRQDTLRAKSGCSQICAKFGFPAEIIEDLICAIFGSYLIRANSGSNQIRANFGSNPVRAKIGQNQKMEIKLNLPRSPMLKTLLKIRGRIFLGRRELMQRSYKIRGRIFSWPARPDAA